MICPRCHRDIPEKKLLCLACAEEDSHKAAINLQFTFMPRVMSEEIPLNLCNPGRGKVHAMLFGSGGWSFCWQRMPTVPRMRFQAVYRDAEKKVTCVDCRRLLNALVTRNRESGQA
jgi:hypothetical protein